MTTSSSLSIPSCCGCGWRPCCAAPIAPLQSQLCWGPLALQPGQTVALVRGHPLELTPKEALLLEQLLRARGASCRKSELLHACGDGRRVVGEDALRAHMRNLRQKLTAAGCDPNLIETVYGHGYRLHASATD